MSYPKIAFTKSSVVSKDGTTIGYKSIGRGLGMILIHSALRDSNDLTKLAQELSDSFTVHVMDRRGREMSGPQGPEYSLSKECEDVQIVQEATKALFLFGHSFGGLISLEAARRIPAITKMALYEPGVSIHQTNWNWMSNYEKAMEKNDFREAFAHFVRGMGHTPLTRLPKWYAKLILRVMIRGVHWNKTVKLLPENLNEHKEVRRLESTYRNYREVNADVLLISGGKSPNSVKQMIQALDQTIARTKTLTLPKLDHFGPDNENAPAEVAQYIRKFFLS